MAQLKVGIVEGWSAPMDFQLMSDGVVQDLSGMSVEGVARNRYEQSVNLTGDVTILDATDGQVRLIPDTGDFASTDSPYELRFKITDGASQIAYWPSDEAILIQVRP